VRKWFPLNPPVEDASCRRWGVLEKLGLGLNEALRYAFGGLLAWFFAAYLEPEKTEKMAKALGEVLSPLVAVSLGAAIYVTFRHAIGELVLFPFCHFLHKVWDTVRRRRGMASTAPTAYLAAFGVRFGLRRTTYTLLRHSPLFTEKEASRYDLAHAELSILYLAALETIGAGVYEKVSAVSGGANLLKCGGLILLVALLADIKQHQIECDVVRLKGEDAIREFLKKLGFKEERALH
jgi:uncharacterized membrane protein